MVTSRRPGPDARRGGADRVVSLGSAPAGPVVGESSDFTGKLRCRGCRPGPTSTTGCVRRPGGRRRAPASRPPVASVPRRPTARASASSGRGDTCGQGWGINPDCGGLRIYEAMRRPDPDFFLHSGDTIYADGPLRERSPLPDGTRVAQHRHAGEGEGRRDPGRVPGQLPLQPAGRERPPVQRRGAERRPVGRPRGDQQLVPGRDPRPTPATRRRTSTCWRPARRRRSTSTSRSARTADEAGRVYRRSRYGPLAGRVRARHAQLPRPEHARTGQRRAGPTAHPGRASSSAG